MLKEAAYNGIEEKIVKKGKIIEQNEELAMEGK